MTDKRKTSEDLIREARSRLESGAGSAEPPEKPVDDERRVDHDDFSEPASSEPPIPRVEAQAEEVALQTEAADYAEPNWSPTPAESSPRRSFFTSRWLRLAIFVAIGLGYGFFTSLDDASRDSGGEIVSGGDLDVMNVQTGDCFDDPGADEEVVFQLQAIPCSEPHDNEVFAVESVAGVFGAAYPGRQALEEHAYEVCSGPIFDSYVGTTYLDSSLEVFTLTPTDDSWSEGDRDFVCVLYNLDFTKLTHSARNSGL